MFFTGAGKTGIDAVLRLLDLGLDQVTPLQTYLWEQGKDLRSFSIFVFVVGQDQLDCTQRSLDAEQGPATGQECISITM